jgi:hypothetical protein
MIDKAYKKIYVNGDCVVDFTKQTLTEDTVSSDNLFFNNEGELINGKSDDFTAARAYFSSSSSLGVSSQSGLRFSVMEYYAGHYAWSSVFGNYNFPCLQYLKTGRLTGMSTSDYNYSPPYDQKSIYFPKINVAEERKSSFYSQLITKLYSQGSTHQIFFEEDLSKFGITDYDPGLVISNCSNIKTTGDGAFDYIISNNKVYLLSINVEPSYTAANVTRDTTLELTNPSGDSITRDGWTLKVPDTIEGLPVVSIGAGFFSYSMSSYYGNNGPSTRWLSECLKIELPSHLEILGPECFVKFQRGSSVSEILPGIKFPDTLKRIYGGPNSSYNTFKEGDSYLFTETDSLPLPDFEKIDINILKTINAYIKGDSSMSSLKYLPSKTSPQAYYIGEGDADSADLVLPEGCKGILNIPGNVTSIKIPESVVALGQIRNNSQLTSISFNNNRTSMTEFPKDFLYSCSALTSFSIPEGITKLPQYFISSCNALTSINIPEGVTKLSKNCIEYCSALTSISIPEGVTYIPEYFTNSCRALTTVNFPEGITKIDSYSFQGCPISYIRLPSTLTQVGYSVFQEPSSVTSKTIEIKAKTPPSLSSSTSLASTSSKITKIIVPKGCLNTYKTTYNWKNYAAVMEESTEW